MENDSKGWVRRKIEEQVEQVVQGASGPEGGATQGLNTFIDRGAEFDGTLRLKAPARIDGDFRGAIESETSVVVGEAAGVEARIEAREVIVGGAVVGDVSASRQLVLRETGRIHGDVTTPSLIVEKGAILNGRTTMERPEVTHRRGARERPAPSKAAARPASAPTPGATPQP